MSVTFTSLISQIESHPDEDTKFELVNTLLDDIATQVADLTAEEDDTAEEVLDILFKAVQTPKGKALVQFLLQVENLDEWAEDFWKENIESIDE